jgi:dethiobiotin synthetase
MALVAYWQRFYGNDDANSAANYPLGVFKPVQCGPRDDAGQYHRRLKLNQSPDAICPVSLSDSLEDAIAPMLQNQTVCLEAIWRNLERLHQQREFVLIEGFGGLGTPLSPETTVADLAWDWRLPTILVVPVGPEAIAQAVAHVALAQQSRVHLKGIILNCVNPCSEQECDRWASPDLIQSLTQKPVLGCIPHLEDATNLETLAQVASRLDLGRLLPLSLTQERLVSLNLAK